MSQSSDIRCIGSEVYFLPVHTRMPLKFGAETVTFVTCARVALHVVDRSGNKAVGWGETPLSVTWVWPSSLPYETRHQALRDFCCRIAARWNVFEGAGHAMEVGHDFEQSQLHSLWEEWNQAAAPDAQMPWLAALVCASAFDIALHDAFGKLLGIPCFQSLTPDFLNRDLSAFLEPAGLEGPDFTGRFPSDFLVQPKGTRLAAWHLVGGVDPLDESEATGKEPTDGYPVFLKDWILRDGLRCLKVKLRGNDPDWDYQRMVRVGRIAMEHGVYWLSADFNCMVTDPEYVNGILDQLRDDEPRIYGMLLYVEQPFPYELETHRIDTHSVSARKPLFLDESAHDWKLVRLGRELGWTGVALKTCKTLTGAVLSACWARAHGMTLMVQDLTNPMIAQIPHVLLAAHCGTIMGVETNAMQFYPEASSPEAVIHPGLYQRRDGSVDWKSIQGPGMGYRHEEIHRTLPAPDYQQGMPS